ncbi:MAG: hypothetical protein ACKVHE_10365 [Planctomycetales bacterium]
MLDPVGKFRVAKDTAVADGIRIERRCFLAKAAESERSVPAALPINSTDPHSCHRSAESHSDSPIVT